MLTLAEGVTRRVAEQRLARARAERIDTGNRFLVGTFAGGDKIAVHALTLGPGYAPHVLSRDDALALAAWIVAVSGERPLFDALLDRIEAS